MHATVSLFASGGKENAKEVYFFTSALALSKCHQRAVFQLQIYLRCTGPTCATCSKASCTCVGASYTSPSLALRYYSTGRCVIRTGTCIAEETEEGEEGRVKIQFVTPLSSRLERESTIPIEKALRVDSSFDNFLFISRYAHTSSRILSLANLYILPPSSGARAATLHMRVSHSSQARWASPPLLLLSGPHPPPSTPDSVIMAILIKSLREVKWRGEERGGGDAEKGGRVLYPPPAARNA